MERNVYAKGLKEGHIRSRICKRREKVDYEKAERGHLDVDIFGLHVTVTLQRIVSWPRDVINALAKALHPSLNPTAADPAATTVTIYCTSCRPDRPSSKVDETAKGT